MAEFSATPGNAAVLGTDEPISALPDSAAYSDRLYNHDLAPLRPQTWGA